MTIDDTIQFLESRLRDNPKSLIFARLADLYLLVDRIDDSIVLCNEGLKHHPTYITANFVLSKAYLAKNDNEQAEIELKKVLSHDRQFLSAHKLLGDLMAKMGWENKAALHYRDILRIDPLEEHTQELIDMYPFEETPPAAQPAQKETEQNYTQEKPHPAEIQNEQWENRLEELFPTKEPTKTQDTLPDKPDDDIREDLDGNIPESQEDTPPPESQESPDQDQLNDEGSTEITQETQPETKDIILEDFEESVPKIEEDTPSPDIQESVPEIEPVLDDSQLETPELKSDATEKEPVIDDLEFEIPEIQSNEPILDDLELESPEIEPDSTESKPDSESEDLTDHTDEQSPPTVNAESLEKDLLMADEESDQEEVKKLIKGETGDDNINPLLQSGESDGDFTLDLSEDIQTPKSTQSSESDEKTADTGDVLLTPDDETMGEKDKSDELPDTPPPDLSSDINEFSLDFLKESEEEKSQPDADMTPSHPPETSMNEDIESLVTRDMEEEQDLIETPTIDTVDKPEEPLESPSPEKEATEIEFSPQLTDASFKELDDDPTTILPEGDSEEEPDVELKEESKSEPAKEFEPEPPAEIEEEPEDKTVHEPPQPVIEAESVPEKEKDVQESEKKGVISAPSTPDSETPKEKKSKPKSVKKEKKGNKIISPTLGEIYAAQGQYSKAIKVYENLIEKNPDTETKYREKIEELKQKLNDSSR